MKVADQFVEPNDSIALVLATGFNFNFEGSGELWNAQMESGNNLPGAGKVNEREIVLIGAGKRPPSKGRTGRLLGLFKYRSTRQGRTDNALLAIESDRITRQSLRRA